MRLLGSESGIVFYFGHRYQYGGTEITEELLCRKKRKEWKKWKKSQDFFEVDDSRISAQSKKKQ